MGCSSEPASYDRVPGASPEQIEPVSRLQALLSAGTFVVCGEMSPPKGPDRVALLNKVKHFQGIVDAVNLTDNQAASVRMSSSHCSVLLAEAGLEPIMQATCRDRNRLALQSEILSANACGVRNLLCLSGDDPSIGDHPESKGVWDLDATQLVQLAAGMAEGRFMNEQPISPPPKLFVGAAAHPYGEPFEMRVWSVTKKIEAGAKFFQTQPIFDIGGFEKWMDALRREGLEKRAAIIAGVMPLRSVKALKHMAEKVPGLRFPQELAQKIEAADDPEAEGVRICVETIRRLRQISGVAGIHIMPAMKESLTPRIVEEAGLLPRPLAHSPNSPETGSMARSAVAAVRVASRGLV
ncbi:MAG: methylenetetrahydrofolate reductase [Armatimonadetes bacterium]|nr:methylenetetrahydrofolate reductase [Armatimonadota bacterium]